MTFENLQQETPPSISPQEGLTVEDALLILKRNEKLVSAGAVEEIVAGFSEDAVVIFGDLAPLRGRQALREFLSARFARQKGYQLRKTLRAVSANTLAGTWVGEWDDAKTGKHMLVRGAEFMSYRDGLCDRWDAMVNIWEAGSPGAVPVL